MSKDKESASDLSSLKNTINHGSRDQSGTNTAITDDEVEKVAYLARLAIDENQKDKLTHDLQQILGFVNQLAELDTTDISPMTSVIQTNTPMRDDNVKDGNCSDLILSNAPDRVQDFFAVPKVVE